VTARGRQSARSLVDSRGVSSGRIRARREILRGPLRRRRSASCSTSAPPGTRRSIADRRTQTTRGKRAVGWLGSRFHGQASSTRQRTASGRFRAGTPRPRRRVFVHAGIKLLNRRFGRRHGFTPFYLHPKCFQFMKLCCDGCRRCAEIVHPLLVIHGTRPLCLRIRRQAKPCSVSGEFRGFRKIASSAPIVPEAQPGERLPRTPGGGCVVLIMRPPTPANPGKAVKNTAKPPIFAVSHPPDSRDQFIPATIHSTCPCPQ
jgi:hypothetical protein